MCVHCSVSSTVRYWHAAWWGAPARDLHATLWGLLPDILASRQFVRSGPHEERQLSLSNPPLTLGGPPRSCYPLVVILARDLRDNDHLRPDDTVALVSVIHIQDEQCSLPSGVIAQYLKQANGNLSCLKALEIRDASSLKASTGRSEDRSGRDGCISSRAPVCPVMGASSGAASCATALSLSGTRTTHQGALRVNLTGVSSPSSSGPVHPVTGCQR
ncbi:unnamed protein product [Plutella xylostella]|uniref:(diamondback moth) hypothetical protein n=1 Tax=Plutella xylostella TaxID=51655 RepID=A0A8S4FK71_PLUXY|nr:unnamed protein product [Plutella xylostella]